MKKPSTKETKVINKTPEVKESRPSAPKSKSRLNYIGIDQSYTSTGLVILNSQNKIVHHMVISSDPKEDKFKRAWEISEAIKIKVKEYMPCRIAIEGLAFAMQGNATKDLAGLQFLIVSKIKFQLNKKITIVPPNTLKKFATGNGQANKNDMLAKLPENIKTFFEKEKFNKSNGLCDLSDAYFLASYIINDKKLYMKKTVPENEKPIVTNVNTLPKGKKRNKRDTSVSIKEKDLLIFNKSKGETKNSPQKTPTCRSRYHSFL